MSSVESTYVAVLTPQGRGAVAVTRISGPLAESAIDPHFQASNGKPICQQPTGRIIYGHWGSTNGEEVVLCQLRRDVVEVHCHGGLAASTAIVKTLEKAGCIPIPWTQSIAQEEFDPIAASARLALAEARTTRTAAILLDQYRGALKTAFSEIEQLAHSENPADRLNASNRVNTLLARASIGLHLTVPWRIAIAGRPNVGKSSLINVLLGYNRTIVFDQPGTTRDVVTAMTAFDGSPVELSDTAGLRETCDEVESAGVARTESQCAAADLVILVLDLTDLNAPADPSLLAAYPKALVVYNKCDLVPPETRLPSGLAVSALTQSGLAELQQAIIQRLITVPLQPGDPVPFTSEHVERLHALQARLSEPFTGSD